MAVGPDSPSCGPVARRWLSRSNDTMSVIYDFVDLSLFSEWSSVASMYRPFDSSVKFSSLKTSSHELYSQLVKMELGLLLSRSRFIKSYYTGLTATKPTIDYTKDPWYLTIQDLLTTNGQMLLMLESNDCKIRLPASLARVARAFVWTSHHGFRFKFTGDDEDSHAASGLYDIYQKLEYLFKRVPQFKDAWQDSSLDVESIISVARLKSSPLRSQLSDHWHQVFREEYPDAIEYLESCLTGDGYSLSYEAEYPDFHVAWSSWFGLKRHFPLPEFPQTYWDLSVLYWDQHYCKNDADSVSIQSRDELSAPRQSTCLPMMIKGKSIDAQPDTGAEGGNFMPLDLVDDLCLKIRRKDSDRKCFTMANGKIARAYGRVKTSCAFANEASRKMTCWFYVFEKLAVPLIIGSQFLAATKTISKYTNRLTTRTSCASFAPVVNFVGSTQKAKRRLLAFVDDRQTYVNADSGSDLDLMSPEYVRNHGYRIDRRIECRKRVQFADTTTAEMLGQVEAMVAMKDGHCCKRLFDVLPGLTSDVILGASTLTDLEVFTAYEESFEDIEAGERFLELSILSYLGKVNNFFAKTFHVGFAKPRAPQQRK